LSFFGGNQMLARILTGISSLLVISGCTIHPVPEDVTGVTTFHIVKQIRCEARKAAVDFIKAQLRQQAEFQNNPVAKDLLEKYAADPEAINSFKPELFSAYREYRHFYNVIYSAAIGYSFDLTMTEQNDLGANLNFLGPWKNPLTLNAAGNFDRTRSNQRTFTISDTFEFLLARLNTKQGRGYYCDNYIVQENFIYPIAGKVGVDKTVQAFFDLQFLGGLTVKQGETGPPTLVDDLKFTTTVDGSGMPKVVFAPIGAAFQIADASVTGLVRRTDIHEVTVGLAVDPKGLAEAALLEGFLFPGTGVARGSARGSAGSSVVSLSRISGVGGTKAQDSALEAIDKYKRRQIQLLPPQ
jgi:hypothetical protein